MLKRIGTMTSICVLAATLATGCTPQPKNLANAYWQRIETHSALYLTGPKAQQQLEQNIAGCVRVVDELVELNALRETTPPDTHSSYHKALEKSGDLDYFETPSRYKDMRVDHNDFHDFESCMRSEGWERVRFVRYQQADQAKHNYKVTQAVRKYGTTSVREAENRMNADNNKGDFDGLSDK